MFTLTISNEQPSIYVPGRTRTIQNTETAPVLLNFIPIWMMASLQWIQPVVSDKTLWNTKDSRPKKD